jgi:hypothetical protein
MLAEVTVGGVRAGAGTVRLRPGPVKFHDIDALGLHGRLGARGRHAQAPDVPDVALAAGIAPFTGDAE